MPRHQSCCAPRGWPSEVTVLKWISVVSVLMLGCVLVALGILCVAVLQLVTPAQELAHNATVAASTVTASIEAIHVEEWRQTVDDLDAVLKSDGVKFFTSQWSSLGISAMVEAMSLLASHLELLDFEALAIVLNKDAMHRTEHILQALDRGVLAYENSHAADVISARDLAVMAAHMRNLTESMDILVHSLAHTGVHVNLGVGETS